MTVSIIIAVKGCSANLRECVNKCLNLEFKDYEILILPDSLFEPENVFSSAKIKIIPTGNITPPYKRDLAAKEAKGEILAFLDDDAYPDQGWLREAVKIFESDNNISCVCGPAVTPEGDSLMQKASGLIYSSLLVSGNHFFRYLPAKKREVSDFPSCNFLIRRDSFEKVGGFDKPYWPGEDTFLCLKILTTGRKMVYDPAVLVFHHRRPLFRSHLNQIKNYALHRGYFAKRYSKTSLRFEYFIPSLFLIGLISAGLLSLFGILRVGYFMIIALYLSAVFLSTLALTLVNREKPLDKSRLFPVIFSGIILTHLVYGLYFIKGLSAKRMPEE